MLALSPRGNPAYLEARAPRGTHVPPSSERPESINQRAQERATSITSGTPRRTPIAVTTTLSRTMAHATFDGVAPMATRTPISHRLRAIA